MKEKYKILLRGFVAGVFIWLTIRLAYVLIMLDHFLQQHQ